MFVKLQSFRGLRSWDQHYVGKSKIPSQLIDATMDSIARKVFKRTLGGDNFGATERDLTCPRFAL